MAEANQAMQEQKGRTAVPSTIQSCP